MDNASKALFMAASVLLGVLLLTAMVYVFRAGARIDENYDATQGQRQLELFNAKFEDYSRTDNNILDVISVANQAYSINKNYSYDARSSVKVIIKINDKYFVIPGNELSDYTLRNNLKGKNYTRNKILSTGNSFTSLSSANVISIYDLVDSTLENIANDHSSNKDDKLSLSRLGSVPKLDDLGHEMKDDEGNTIYRNNVTIYKYLFDCRCICGENAESGIKYNNAGGKVQQIEFEMYTNNYF